MEQLAIMRVNESDFGQRQSNSPSLVPAAALIQEPDEQRCQSLDDRVRAQRQVHGLVMLDDQRAGQVRKADGERPAVDLRNQHASRVRPEAHVAGRPAPDGRTQIALLDKPEPLQHVEAVSDDGAAKFGPLLDLQPCRREPVTDERQDRDQAGAPIFQCTRAANPSLPAGGTDLFEAWRRGGHSSALTPLLFHETDVAIDETRIWASIRPIGLIFQQKFQSFCSILN